MGARHIKCLIALFFLSFLLAIPSVASAFDGFFTSESIFQARRATNNRYETPFYQYNAIGISDLPLNFTFDTSFQGLYDGKANNYTRFDLYQAVFALDVYPERVRIIGGRQFADDGFQVLLRDGLTIEVAPPGPVGFDLYFGIPRYLEDGNFTGVTEGMMTGVNVRTQGIKNLGLTFSARYSKINITRTAARTNDTVQLGLAGTYSFASNAWTPAVYAGAEYDIGGKTMDVANLGIDFYPHWRLAINVEGGYYNTSRNSTESKLFKTYFADEMIQAIVGSSIKLPKGFGFFENAAYQNSAVRGRGRENSYLVEAGFSKHWKRAGLSSKIAYYFQKSFGGTVHGAYLDLGFEKFIAEPLSFDFGADVSHYNKITNDDGTAFSFIGGLNYNFVKGFTAVFGGEFNRNEFFNREARVTLMLTMDFDGDMLRYHPERKPRRIRPYRGYQEGA